MDFNPYKVLSVDQEADVEIITAVYRSLSKRFHPDINRTPEAAVKMRDINRAYDMLKDPAERRKVDEQLAREAAARSSTSSSGSSSSRAGYGSYGTGSTSRSNAYTPRPSGYRPSSSSTSSPSSGSSSPFDQFREWTQRWGRADAPSPNEPQTRTRERQPKDEPKPTAPSDKTLYLYKKSLVDDVNRKALRVSVYYESARGTKICEIYSSAPDNKGKVVSGTVYFRSEELYDFVLAIEEAVKAFDYTESPIEVQADHVIYWRRTVQGTSKTFLGLEIVKKNRAVSKEALLLLGEKTASGGIEGVAAPQTAKQIQQLARIMAEALAAMRPA